MYKEYFDKTKRIVSSLDNQLVGLECYYCKEKITTLPHKCFENFSTVNILTCKECSKLFVDTWKTANVLNCSHKCSIKNKGNYLSKGLLKVAINCKWCGKEFKVWPYRLKGNKEICCSRSCFHSLRRQFFKDHPEEREKCSKRMKIISKSDSFINAFRQGLKKSKTGLPNQIEGIVKYLSSQASTYTGNFDFEVKFKDGSRKYPDFILNPIEKTKKVIEVAGNFWHTKEEMDLVVKKYKEVGYDCLVLWGNEIAKNPYGVANKILKFTHTLQIGIFKLDKGLLDPNKAYEFDSGFDIYSRINQVIPPGQNAMIPCGVILILPYFIECQLRGRSGLAKKGILAHFGTVDSQFRGEVGPILFNTTKEPFEIKKGDKIAQMVISLKSTPPIPVEFIEVKEVDSFEETARGTKGFGSSGK